VVGVVVACYGKIEFIDSEGCQVGVDYIISLRGIPAVNQNFECVGSDKTGVALINIELVDFNYLGFGCENKQQKRGNYPSK
jgi:hypothetical protein